MVKIQDWNAHFQKLYGKPPSRQEEIDQLKKNYGYAGDLHLSKQETARLAKIKPDQPVFPTMSRKKLDDPILIIDDLEV